MSLLFLSHHSVRLWYSPKRWPRAVPILVKIRSNSIRFLSRRRGRRACLMTLSLDGVDFDGFLGRKKGHSKQTSEVNGGWGEGAAWQSLVLIQRPLQWMFGLVIASQIFMSIFFFLNFVQGLVFRVELGFWIKELVFLTEEMHISGPLFGVDLRLVWLAWSPGWYLGPPLSFSRFLSLFLSPSFSLLPPTHGETH